jgi:hypothetical protein
MPVIVQRGGQVLVILDETNYSRIGNADPLVINIAGVEHSSGHRADIVVVTFAPDDKMGEIVRLFREGNEVEALALACSGIQRKPGDDAPMVRMPRDGSVH